MLSARESCHRATAWICASGTEVLTLCLANQFDQRTFTILATVETADVLECGRGVTVTTRRANHEGSNYQRSSDGRWIGAIRTGRGANGKPLRKYVSASTRFKVVGKLRLGILLAPGIQLSRFSLTTSSALNP